MPFWQLYLLLQAKICENEKCVIPHNFNAKWVQLILTRSTIFATTFIHTLFETTLHHQSCIIVRHMECNQGKTQEYKIFRPQKVLEVQNVYYL